MERERLNKLADELAVAVRFLGDLRGEELRREWEDANLFVLPGTGGLAIQEALSHSLPVIVAGGDGTERDLVTPENGWVIPASDAEALRDAIATALSDPERLARFGAESRRIATEEVNLESMCQTFVTAMRYCAVP